MAEVQQAAGLKRAGKKQQSPDITDTGVKMDQDPASSDSAQTSQGVVNNTQPLTEQEAEQLLAPEDFAEEEARLREQREQDAAQDVSAPAEKVLSNERFKQLDALISRAGMYSQFLSEQMKSYKASAVGAQQEQTADDEEPADVKGKRKRGGKTQQPNKKAKTDMDGAVAKGEAAAAAAAGVGDAAGTLLEKQKAIVPLIQGELRDYQLAGVTWLISLYQNGLNGMLADQMGLGKTVQTISFLSHLRSNGVNGPFLIIGPLSTLRNWVSEVRRFCPSMPVLEYHGNGAKARAQLRKQHMPPGAADAKFPCVVSTYEIVMADIKALAHYQWKYVIVDEGHRLKNFECKLIRDLRTLPADNKLLLTGTPLQNNLSELWSLLNFLLPEVFADLSDFQSWFDFGDAVGSEAADKAILALEQRNNVVSKLHNLLKPFMLRRLKADVEICLPRKQEILLYAPMTAKQQEINAKLLDKSLMDQLAELAESEGTSTKGMKSGKNMLMDMRKNCNHPDLIESEVIADLDYPPPEKMIEECGKLALLDRLLTKLHQKGHKVLIFSQMTKMLDLIDSYLSQTGHQACRIDGSVNYEARQEAIDLFNTDPDTWVFLLSTRAGGLGINLTAADTVIIYDSDWNPHQDLQAMDRCHRIGQTKPVLVFRLATSNSVEGKMLRRAGDKMALERLVIKKGVFKEVLDTSDTVDAHTSISSMSAAELLAVLRSDFSMDDVPQSGVVDDVMLDKLLDRTWMLSPQDQKQQQPTDSTKPAAKQAARGKGVKGRATRSQSPEEESAAAANESAVAAGASRRELQTGLPYPAQGIGYEVVQALQDSGLISNVN